MFLGLTGPFEVVIVLLGHPSLSVPPVFSKRGSRPESGGNALVISPQVLLSGPVVANLDSQEVPTQEILIQ